MSKFCIDCERFHEEERRALEEALSPLAESDAPLLIEISLVGEEEILELNRRFRDTCRVTDVLSFPAFEGIKGKFIGVKDHAIDLDEEGRLFLGSVAVCEKRAREQAEEYNHSYERELFYLAVHGILHCLGFDHETQADKEEMREREEFVMSALKLKRGEE